VSAIPWLLVAAGAALLPADAGLHLPPCPTSPNCVSTQTDPADAGHRIEPLRWPEGWTVEAVLDAFAEVLANEPRSALVMRDGPRLEATFTSRVFRFVDDLVVVADAETRTLHLRSAARLGYGDFGVNRRRADRLLDALADRVDGARRAP
jgi:uncharacterized protein (DUF1499 family)